MMARNVSVQIESPKEVVRVWSPRTVAWYGVLLGFPGGLAVAIRNWKALRMDHQARVHLLGGVIFSIVLAPILFVLPHSLNRGLGIGLTIGTFFYLKSKFTGDIAHAQLTCDVQQRPWYSALGWAVLGLIAFIFLLGSIAMGLGAFGIEIAD